jgi:hypothetical protein
MKQIMYALILTAMAAVVGLAQEERGKVALGFTNANTDYFGTNARGINASGQFKAYEYDGVKLEAVGDFAVLFVNGERIYTLLAGPQVGVDLFKNRFNPFARILFGASIYEGSVYGYSAGFGVDVNVSKNTFIRGTYDRQVFNGSVQPVYRTTIAVGRRF